MRHIKIYEYYKVKPKEGDYVLCQDEKALSINLYLKDNIGQIIKAYPSGTYLILFKNTPPGEIAYNFTFKGERVMIRSEIKHFSKNIEDIKLIIQTSIINNKFNI